MMRFAMAAVVAMGIAGCGAASGRITPERLGLSARDAFVEARSVARSWAPDPRLRWVQGEGIMASGQALPDQGYWEFHYTSSGHTRELVVRVLPLETTSEEQPATSPPGYVLGDNALDTGWIDSGDALQAVAGAAGATPSEPAAMMLIPTRPAQWVIRVGSGGPRWRIHAATGEVLEQ